MGIGHRWKGFIQEGLLDGGGLSQIFQVCAEPRRGDGVLQMEACSTWLGLNPDPPQLPAP